MHKPPRLTRLLGRALLAPVPFFVLVACGSRSSIEIGSNLASRAGGTDSGGIASGGATSGGVSSGGVSSGGVSSGGVSSGGASSGGAVVTPGCLPQTDEVSVAWGPAFSENVTGLAVRGETIALSYDADAPDGRGLHFSVVREGSVKPVTLGFELPPLDWFTAGVTIDDRAQIWATVEEPTGGSGPPWLVRIDPDPSKIIELRGVRVLKVATDDFGSAYVMSQDLDEVLEIYRVNLETGEIPWVIFPREGARIEAMAMNGASALLRETDLSSGRAT
jgi:hypothetical protein